jgi:hypothetical protein
MNRETPYGERVHEHPGGNILISDSMVNVVNGIVHAQHVNHMQSTVRIRAGGYLDLRAKLPLDEERCFFPGQAVIAVIPAEAVRLEAGLFRRSRQRLNRWHGRIVLIKSLDEGPLITAKFHGEGWTLTSTMPILGSTHSPRIWDPVTIVVDPHRIELFPSQRQAPREPKVLESYYC